MKHWFFIVKNVRSNTGVEIKNKMEISEISKLDGGLSHTSFDLKILGRLIKLKAWLLKVKLNLYLEIDFLIISLVS